MARWTGPVRQRPGAALIPVLLLPLLIDAFARVHNLVAAVRTPASRPSVEVAMTYDSPIPGRAGRLATRATPVVPSPPPLTDLDHQG